MLVTPFPKCINQHSQDDKLNIILLNLLRYLTKIVRVHRALPISNQDNPALVLQFLALGDNHLDRENKRRDSYNSQLMPSYTNPCSRTATHRLPY